MRWEVERLAGDLVAAERVARFALDSLPSEGETIARADLTTILGLAACGQGRYEEAATYVEQSERLGVPGLQHDRPVWSGGPRARTSGRS